MSCAYWGAAPAPRQSPPSLKKRSPSFGSWKEVWLCVLGVAFGFQRPTIKKEKKKKEK